MKCPVQQRFLPRRGRTGASAFAVQLFVAAAALAVSLRGARGFSTSKDVDVGFVGGSPTSNSVQSSTQRTVRAFATNRSEGVDSDEEDTFGPKDRIGSRRMLLASSLALVTSAALVEESGPSRAQAYDRTFPGELNASDAEQDDGERWRRSDATVNMPKRRSVFSKSPFFSKALGTMLWSGSLWLLSGSRSNPLVTPLANVLYDGESESWLKDRNDGLFSRIPAPLVALVALLFVAAGYSYVSTSCFWKTKASLW